MLTIQELRDTLPDKGTEYTDEQMEEMSRTLYGLADICFDMWLAERNKKKVIEQNQTATSPDEPSPLSPSN